MDIIKINYSSWANMKKPRGLKMKTIMMIFMVALIFGCYEVDEIEMTESNSIPVIIECDSLPPDACTDGKISLFEQDENCAIEIYTEICKHGCVDEGASGSVRCLDPCELNPCEIPDNICESTVFLVEFKQSTCVLADNDAGYECIKNIGTRRYCGCVEPTDERGAHCYGES